MKFLSRWRRQRRAWDCDGCPTIPTTVLKDAAKELDGGDDRKAQALVAKAGPDHEQCVAFAILGHCQVLPPD
ncbi:hypothetical protein QNO07_09440 [Streptomyces sp. 549]|uniref:hypothetical protein n=1 Tax=Streptomyces sp. 549 TaxID=3049076 RepID=UPI0024C2CB8C|nr:hypothetical protein [Streptomyces sp. 549]MDK1473642.1 hypothetical protein [Streptomyces sp. 549]